ncbi:Rrf2 family transcriptional regulator [Myroides odoratimimus]|nr:MULTISPECIES: Rrf2 family transcriptional regulator [Myroides]MCA4792596.1 Rrf2 family transcriptional regulator [Myroides odoratimimus]MCA4807372.1 Rrf2 family transcriptional regulator [Myroides odoratimimus]MCA4819962.1 Rrf2 family transcriptional regulator [Myroides odoratimimus]MCS7474537.1 Rrf2 family transcriptional regulator [Myroides odoratimimus]MDM1035874.1 Rrf2 family transcriptional regulator [Myroides odoratimimus]
MLSKRCKYALKAMVCLARVYQNGHLTIATIAEKENIPKKFLEQILLELKRVKLVNSKKGLAGGYYLIKDPKEVSVADLYRIFDGPIALTPCVSINYYEPCDDCEDEVSCYLRKQFMEIRDKTRKSMSEATLQRFIDGD